jgi:hypothetical protein
MIIRIFNIDKTYFHIYYIFYAMILNHYIYYKILYYNFINYSYELNLILNLNLIIIFN